MGMPRVMRLIDPHSGRMKCPVCGSEHNAGEKSEGYFHYGSWQCAFKCKIGDAGKKHYNGKLDKWQDELID